MMEWLYFLVNMGLIRLKGRGGGGRGERGGKERRKLIFLIFFLIFLFLFFYYYYYYFRDYIGELCAACRKEGLGFGVYYSLMEWTPSYGNGKSVKKVRFLPSKKKKKKKKKKKS